MRGGQERTAKPEFRLYIDESGDHTYKLLENPGHRYLALLGVWFRLADHYVQFDQNLDRFKTEIFGERPDEPVILHRSSIVNRKGAFGILREDPARKRLDAGLLKLIAQAQCSLVCVVIDKKSHSEKYKSPFHPYHYCLAAMLDRYSGWLAQRNSMGDVMPESRGTEEDTQLMQAYKRVYESGTLQFDRFHHQKALTSKELKLRRKRENIAGLQLADVLAFPVKQACLLEKGLVSDPGEVFGKNVFRAAEGKFNVHVPSGKIEGYGKIWL